MGRTIFQDLSVVPEWKVDLDPNRVPELEELLKGLAAREKAWAEQVAAIRGRSEQQAAFFAEREAAHSARETALISRLEQRGRVIDELTMFLSEMTSLRQEEAQALEETQEALKLAKSRLAKTRRAARLISSKRSKKPRLTPGSSSVPID